MLVLGGAQTARAQVYYLTLKNQTIDVPNRTVYVEQVVDGRVGQPAIGTVYRGLQNQRATVLFQQGLEPELTALLRQQLPSRPTDHAVVLCIRQLRVGEVINGLSERASADLAADVYAHLPDGYHFVRSVADHTSDRALETTARHAPHLASLLSRCLMQLSETDWTQAGHHPARTLAQLPADRPPVALRPAILKVARPRPGIYHYFEEFLANRPDTTLQLQFDTLRQSADGWEGTTLLQAKARNANGERVPPREIWGFSDGRQTYLGQRHPRFMNSVYYPLVRQDDLYTFVAPAPLDVSALNQRALNQNYGASIRAAGQTGKTALNGQEDTSRQPAAYALDMRTGQAALFPPLGQPQRPDTAFIYVYQPLNGHSEAQRLLMNDREVGQLQPGQYLELAWPHYGSPVRLTLGKAGGPTLLVVPSTSTPNYVKLVPGSALSPWQWMPVRLGEAEVDALDKLRR
jgi:hypothetical protein